MSQQGPNPSYPTVDKAQGVGWTSDTSPAGNNQIQHVQHAQAAAAHPTVPQTAPVWTDGDKPTAAKDSSTGPVVWDAATQ